MNSRRALFTAAMLAATLMACDIDGDAPAVEDTRLDADTQVVDTQSDGPDTSVPDVVSGSDTGADVVEVSDAPEVSDAADANDTEVGDPCDPGYEWVDGGCVNINECTRGTSDCAWSATCTDTEGGWECACPSGFAGTGQVCTNIDECLGSPCQESEDCVDTYGSYVCLCATSSSDGTCEPVGPCAELECGQGQQCVPTADAAVCVSFARNCSALQGMVPTAQTGVYTIDPDGPGSDWPPMSAYCDMETDGGGWTLVLNYVRSPDTDPDAGPRLLENALPMHATLLELPTSVPAGAEVDGPAWGHVRPSLVAALGASELWWQARSYTATGSPRFRWSAATDHPRTIGYVRTGVGQWAQDGDRPPRKVEPQDKLVTNNWPVTSAVDGGDSALVSELKVGTRARWRVAKGDFSVIGGDDDGWTYHHLFVRSRCDVGYRLDPGSGTCVDLDECTVWPGVCADTCDNDEGGYSCSTCGDGEEAVWGRCEDLDECGSGEVVCFDNETCVRDTPTDRCLEPKSCREILDESVIPPPSGVYVLWRDANSPELALCDMESDGGGWTLVLNYDHIGGIVEPPIPLQTRLPVDSSTFIPTTLYTTGAQAPAYWGHAAPSRLAKLAPTELWFRAEHGDPDDVVSFILEGESCRQYFTTGSGGCDPDPFRYGPGRTSNAQIPLGQIAADTYVYQRFNENRGAFAMTDQPFRFDAIAHYTWQLGTSENGNESDAGVVWRTESIPDGSGHYQVWVR